VANQRKVGGQRPLLIGEFGMNTARDPKHGVKESMRAKLQEHPGTEAEQARLFAIVLAAAEKERVDGVLSWCLHDYPIQNPNESHFGLVRADGTMKPAALVLRDTFARWASEDPVTGLPMPSSQPGQPSCSDHMLEEFCDSNGLIERVHLRGLPYLFEDLRWNHVLMEC
jgi:hypothetical protein